MATLSARRSARISTARLGERSKPIPLVTPVVEVGHTDIVKPTTTDLPTTEGRSSESLAFHRLASKNPALLLLVAALDLEETDSTRLKTEPLPPLTDRPTTEPLNSKLKEIAQKAFARGRSYPEDEAIRQLAGVTGVDISRARNGISKMYNQGILSQTLSNEYYLTESTPF